MFKKSRRRSRQTGSTRSHGSAGSYASSSVGTLRSILKLPISHIRTDHSSAGGSSGGSKSTVNTRISAAPRKVTFSNVTFREYERVIGDNPSCSSGAPIGIGWAHGKDETRPIDEYEDERHPRREQPDLVLSRQEREELLVEWGETFQDIIDAIRSNIRIKNQRRSTVNAIGRYDRWEEMMESAGRKIKRTIGLQKQEQNYLNMMPPPTHRAPSTQSYQRPRQFDERPAPVENVIPQKPVRRSSADTPSSKAAARFVSRDLGAEFNDEDNDDDEGTPPSLATSSAGASDNTNQETRDRPTLIGQESGLSYDSNRPADLIEVDTYNDECNESVYTAQSGITMSTHYTDGGFTEAGDSVTSDGFGRLERDTSHWMVGGMDSPRLLRCYNPTIISEDGSYEHMIPPPTDNWQYQGFGMQPPPYSNSIVNRWR